jgi:hypothetical protein
MKFILYKLSCGKGRPETGNRKNSDNLSFGITRRISGGGVGMGLVPIRGYVTRLSNIGNSKIFIHHQ